MHTKGQFRNVMFDSSLHPGSAAAAILVMLLFLIFLLLFMTFTAQPVQGQTFQVNPALAQNASQAAAHNNVPPTARQAATLPQFASRLAREVTPAATHKRRASTRACSNQPSPRDGILYENGPVNGTTDAWTINYGYVVSDSFTGGNATGFDFYAWEFPGDKLISVDWSITSDPNGGSVYGSGTANVTDTFISTNQFGYDIDYISASGLKVSAGGTGWLNLYNASVPSGDPVYWDENSGVGCHSSGCPSQAYENSVGTIPSESFDVTGGGSGCMPGQQGKFKVIHDFSGNGDGVNPSGVAIDKAGNLYGPTTPWRANGLVFRLSQAGSGWVLNPLYNFTGGDNEYGANGVIVGLNGILYGGANGGIQNCPQQNGNSCGSIFGLQPAPTACLTSACSWSENVLYNFTGLTDAWGGIVYASDQAGNLYGVSQFGGALQKGAVFELTPSSGGWVESILYSFTGGSDGQNPTSVLVGNDGNLYGTTQTYLGYDGLIFQLTPSAGGWTETVIHDLGDPYGPQDPTPLVQDSAGDLFVGYTDWTNFGYVGSGVLMLTRSNGQWRGGPFLMNTRFIPSGTAFTAWPWMAPAISMPLAKE